MTSFSMHTKEGTVLVERKILLSLVIALSIVSTFQAIIIARPFNKHVVSTPENAITIAKAELLRRYGEAEIDGLEFDAVRFGERPDYWNVIALPPLLSSQPHVLVRVSDGKVVMRWT